MTTQNRTIGRVSNGILGKHQEPLNNNEKPITSKSYLNILSTEVFKQRIKEQITKIRGIIQRSNKEVTLKFIPPDTITHTPTILNQIIIRYNSGVMEILPPDIQGDKIPRYLGIQIASIKDYAIIPHPDFRMIRGDRKEFFTD